MKIKIIYCDMDGVLTDFDGEFFKLVGEKSPGYKTRHSLKKFWTEVDKGGIEFWSKMPWMKDGKILWNYIKTNNIEILSSPSIELLYSGIGKKIWVNRELGNVKVNLTLAKYKRKFASPNSILIDDTKQNIDQWNSDGGIGILHTSAKNTIRQLKQLGL